MKALNPGEPGQVGRYRLVAALGEGGMGRVLLGAAPDGRLVALKQIHPGLAHDPGFRERFRREVATSRLVSGAYTAAVMDADPDAPTPWLASVFVPGPSLTEAVVAGGPLPPGSLRYLTAGLALALGEIHRAGLVHRDLKPSNVILAADGPRVIDFGIARAVEGTSELTHTGSIIGSPGFMSPEQAEGRPLSPASDVFSLGALLAMAASGHSPFTGTSTPHTLYNVVHNQPDLRSLPPEIRRIAEACLAKDPEQRPTPAWILEQLGPIAPTPTPWPPVVPHLIEQQRVAVHQALHPPKPRKSRRGLAVAGAAAGVVALIAGSIIAVDLTSDDPPPPQPAAQSAPPAPATSTPPNPDPLGTDKLRTVDPCKVLDGRSVDGIGVLKPEIDVHLWTCTYAGPNGDWVDLGLGDNPPIDGVPSGELGGLPLTIKDGLACEASVPVNGRTDAVIKTSTSVTANLDKPCDVAKAMLTEAISRLREDPPQHEQPPGTLIPVAPCALASAAEVQPFLGPVTKVEPEHLHGCQWTVSNFLKIDLIKSHPPVQSKDSYYDVTGTVDVNGTPVYLTKKYREGPASCTLTWLHRPIDDRNAEVVELHHSIGGAAPAPEQVCTPSLEFAKLIMPKLPKP